MTNLHTKFLVGNTANTNTNTFTNTKTNTNTKTSTAKLLVGYITHLLFNDGNILASFYFPFFLPIKYTRLLLTPINVNASNGLLLVLSPNFHFSIYLKTASSSSISSSSSSKSCKTSFLRIFICIGGSFFFAQQFFSLIVPSRRTPTYGRFRFYSEHLIFLQIFGCSDGLDNF